LLVLALCLAACGHHSEEVVLVEPSPDHYALDSGDEIRVIVFEQTQVSQSYIVDPAGQISVPLAGVIAVRGKTTAQVSRIIASRLAGNDLVKDPKVSVEVTTYRPFFIHGEVARSGQYAYVSNMTVETAIAIAGGYTLNADKRSVRLTRRHGHELLVRDAALHDLVRPGDTLYIAERWF
jgi:polysaccharide export outer membrane protein